MRHQNGYIWKENGCWYGRWREDVTENGHVVRKQRSRKLADYSDRFRCEADVRPILDEILRPINEGKADVRGTMSLREFWQSWYWPYVQENLKPSTQEGYRKIWEKHLAPHLGDRLLRDLRTVDVANLLAELGRHGLGRRSLQHCKFVLSSICAHAKNVGALDGQNPVTDAEVPRRAAIPKDTHATTPDELRGMLEALKGEPRARAAIGLMFYAGLRPGEARGVRWEDYECVVDPQTKSAEWQITVRQSVWRTHVTGPKTEGSVKPVLIIEPLRVLLEELRSAEENPRSGFILRGALGRPLDLDRLARIVVKPALGRKGLPWYGWYALRRGIATLIVSTTHDPMAAKGLLRHSSVVTTATHYIKDVPEVTKRGMLGIEQQLCSQCAVDRANQDAASSVRVQ